MATISTVNFKLTGFPNHLLVFCSVSCVHKGCHSSDNLCRHRNNYAPFNPNASRNPVKRTLSFLGSTVAAAASSTAEGGISTTHKFEQLLGGGGGQSRQGLTNADIEFVCF